MNINGLSGITSTYTTKLNSLNTNLQKTTGTEKKQNYDSFEFTEGSMPPPPPMGGPGGAEGVDGEFMNTQGPPPPPQDEMDFDSMSSDDLKTWLKDMKEQNVLSIDDDVDIDGLTDEQLEEIKALLKNMQKDQMNKMPPPNMQGVPYESMIDTND